MSEVNTFNSIFLGILVIMIILFVIILIKKRSGSFKRPEYGGIFTINHFRGLTNGYALGIIEEIIPKSFKDGVRLLITFQPIDEDIHSGIIPDKIRFSLPQEYLLLSPKGEISARREVAQIIPPSIEELPNEHIKLLWDERIKNVTMNRKVEEYARAVLDRQNQVYKRIATEGGDVEVEQRLKGIIKDWMEIQQSQRPEIKPRPKL